jgi:hypothetical protein
MRQSIYSEEVEPNRETQLFISLSLWYPRAPIQNITYHTRLKSHIMRLQALLPVAMLFAGQNAHPIEERSVDVVSLAVKSATSMVISFENAISSIHILRHTILHHEPLLTMANLVITQMDNSKIIIGNETVLTLQEFNSLEPDIQEYSDAYESIKKTLDGKVKEFFHYVSEAKSDTATISLLAQLEASVFKAKTFIHVLDDYKKLVQTEHDRLQKELEPQDEDVDDQRTNTDGPATIVISTDPTNNTKYENIPVLKDSLSDSNATAVINNGNFTSIFEAVVAAGDAYLEKSESLKLLQPLNSSRKAVKQYIKLEAVLEKKLLEATTNISAEPTLNRGEAMALLYAASYVVENLKKVALVTNKWRLQPLMRQSNIVPEMKAQIQKTDAAVEKFWSTLQSKMPFEPILLPPMMTEFPVLVQPESESESQTSDGDGKSLSAVKESISALTAAYTEIVNFFTPLPVDDWPSEEQQEKILELHANIEKVLDESTFTIYQYEKLSPMETNDIAEEFKSLSTALSLYQKEISTKYRLWEYIARNDISWAQLKKNLTATSKYIVAVLSIVPRELRPEYFEVLEKIFNYTKVIRRDATE